MSESQTANATTPPDEIEVNGVKYVRYENDEVLNLAKRIKRIAKDTGLSTSQVAWLFVLWDSWGSGKNNVTVGDFPRI